MDWRCNKPVLFFKLSLFVLPALCDLHLFGKVCKLTGDWNVVSVVLKDTSAVNHISQKTEAALFSVIALLDTTHSVTDEIFNAEETSSFFDLCDLLVDKVYTRLLFDLLHLFLGGVSYYSLSLLLFPLCCPAGLLSLHPPISNHLHQSCFTREGFLLNALIGWTVY